MQILGKEAHTQRDIENTRWKLFGYRFSFLFLIQRWESSENSNKVCLHWETLSLWGFSCLLVSFIKTLIIVSITWSMFNGRKEALVAFHLSFSVLRLSSSRYKFTFSFLFSSFPADIWKKTIAKFLLVSNVDVFFSHCILYLFWIGKSMKTFSDAFHVSWVGFVPKDWCERR